MRVVKALSVLTILVVSSCKNVEPPKPTELCRYERDLDILECNNPTRDPEDYLREIEGGDICRNPQDELYRIKYCLDLYTELSKCKIRLKKKKR